MDALAFPESPPPSARRAERKHMHAPITVANADEAFI